MELKGYMGKYLWVDLAKGTIQEEVPDEQLLKDFLGGYGVGARLLYDRMRPGCDPLGPENILAFLTGPLTGSSAPTGTRFTVCAKSPLTNGWGDSSCSGYFGPALKKAGYDGIFFTGNAEKPVYLYLDDDTAELRSAETLWGKDTYYVEDYVKSELGKDFEAACIGQAGEKLSLISGIMHSRGRAAGRSGLGAVMGAKKVKMIAVRGTKSVPIADIEKEKAAKKRYMQDIKDGVGGAVLYKTMGTPGVLTWCIKNADAPIKNWGSPPDEHPDTDPLEFEKLLEMREKKEACWRCPIACWGTSRTDYNGEEIFAHQPEYETSAAFGSMTLNNHYPSLVKANDLCNRYGLDTISAGTCAAFAIECYQNGIINKEDTGGLVLEWGDHLVMNQLLEKIALQEDIGKLLAMGVKKASEELGPQSVPFAIHVGGQELAMHDPRFEPGLGLIYVADATPGRHTQGSQFTTPPGFETERPGYGVDRDKQEGRGKWGKEALCLTHTMNASGVCLFGYGSTNVTFIPEYIEALTGQPFSIEDMMLVGERIANIRQLFNLREGINMLKFDLPNRAYGRPPLESGETAGIEVNIETMLDEHLEMMDWSKEGAVPSHRVLQKLGLDHLMPA